MDAATNSDGQTLTPTTNPRGHGPILARLTDGNRLTLVGDGVTDLPAAEWFEVVCADGKIVLTPIPSPKEAWRRKVIDQGLTEDEVRPPSEWELTPPADRAKSPYAHLTLEQLRTLEHITLEERLEELRARGLIGGKPKGVGVLNIKPVYPPVPPGALERFLKERG